jgi:hypothetical protein
MGTPQSVIFNERCSLIEACNDHDDGKTSDAIRKTRNVIAALEARAPSLFLRPDESGDKPTERGSSRQEDVADKCPSNPLDQTLDLIPRSTLMSNLIKFLADKPARTAKLRDICTDIYKSKTKTDLRNTGTLIRRTTRILEQRNAPLRLRNVPRLNVPHPKVHPRLSPTANIALVDADATTNAT